MRKVIFGGANTVDNYIAGKDDSIDWIRHSKEVNEIMKRFWETIDTMIMGRRTWEIAMKGGSGSSKGIKSYVCSRTLKKSPGKKIELAPDAVSLVKRLKPDRKSTRLNSSHSQISYAVFCLKKKKKQKKNTNNIQS